MSSLETIPNPTAHHNTAATNEADQSREFSGVNELFSDLVSSQTIAARTEWLKDAIAGEYDASLGHVDRLVSREDQQREDSITAFNDNNYDPERYQKLRQKAVATREFTQKIFGSDVIAEHRKLKDAQWQMHKYSTSKYWGNEATVLAEKLIPTLPDSDIKAELDHSEIATLPIDQVRTILNQRIFIDDVSFNHVIDDSRPRLVLTFDQPLDIPLSNMVSASGFKSWAGRGRGTQSDGSGDKSYRTAGGEAVTGRSIDAIIDYASRTSELPPNEEVIAYIQPNGEVLFEALDDNHRTAAAMLRGDKTLKVNGIRVEHLTENLLEHDQIIANDVKAMAFNGGRN